MKVLITGANSYVGKYLVQHMENCGFEYVTATRDDFDYSNVKDIENFLDSKEITNVIHLAAAISEKAEDIFCTNIQGLYYLLQACAKKKVHHFTFASGNTVYASNSMVPRRETDFLAPESGGSYAFSKYVGELIISDYLSKRGILYANVRIGDIYGPNQKHGNLLKVIVKNAIQRSEICLYGKGRRTRDYIYVKDVVRGLEYISSKQLTGNINLATGVGTSVEELIDVVNELCGGSLNIKHVMVEKEDDSKIVLDVSKLRESGFNIEYSVRNGLYEILYKEIKE